MGAAAADMEGSKDDQQQQQQQDEEGTYRWRELGCIYVALISDAIVQNVIAPFAVSWVRDSFHEDPASVGLYAGLLVGSYSFATALSSPFFGWLSDIIGRRVLIAGGLAVAGSLSMVGGLSSAYWVCFAMRFLAGLLDASQTVAFAAIGDLTTGRARSVVRTVSNRSMSRSKTHTCTPDDPWAAQVERKINCRCQEPYSRLPRHRPTN